MAGCGCHTGGVGGSTLSHAVYLVTAGDGSKSSYSTEVDAAAAAERLDGTYRRIA